MDYLYGKARIRSGVEAALWGLPSGSAVAAAVCGDGRGKAAGGLVA